jgi:hypothetical protein
MANAEHLLLKDIDRTSHGLRHFTCKSFAKQQFPTGCIKVWAYRVCFWKVFVYLTYRDIKHSESARDVMLCGQFRASRFE